MVADNRAAQKHAAGLQLVTTGWPNGLTPQQREYMLGWMLGNTPEIVTYLQGTSSSGTELRPHRSLPERLREFLVQRAVHGPGHGAPEGGFFSGMTLLSFKSWDLRSAFFEALRRNVGHAIVHRPEHTAAQQACAGLPFHTAVAAKLETPLRVLIAACNAHPETQGKRLIILWKTLTLMMPTDERDFQPDHTAWARLFYEEKGRTFKGRLEVVQEFAAILNGPPVEKDGGEETLWAEKWNQTVWGNQLELDDMERQAYHTARQKATAGGTGTEFGRGRKHWSQALLHQSSFSPYPFELEFVGVDKVAFVWDELCDKCNQPNEKVGSYEVATFCGKPAAPDHTASSAEDLLASAAESAAKAAGKGRAASSQSTPPPA